jgi:hypothetical protein
MSKKSKKMSQNETPKRLSWDVPEYEQHVRDRKWYIIAALIGLALIAYAIFTHNYLFALIIVIIAFIIISRDNQAPMKVRFTIEDGGIRLGQKFYEYDKFKNFSVVFRPQDDIRNLYINFNNSVRPHLSIPLKGNDPMLVRSQLLRYMKEDLSRNDAPLSEGLGKMLKL